MTDVFLATTGIEEFWNKEKRVIFLGKWCILGKGGYDNSNYEILPFYFDDRTNLEKAYNYTNVIFGNTLPKIAEALNRYHKIKKNNKYYNTILSYWLLHFIQSTFDKYQAIKNALITLKGFETYTIQDADYYIPIDTNDFTNIYTEDEYALQIYSQIFDFLKVTTAKKRHPLYKNRQNGLLKYTTKNRDTSYKALFYRTQLLINAIFYRQKKLSIVTPYFTVSPTLNMLKFLMTSRFKYPFECIEYNIDIETPIDKNFRYQKLDDSKDEFEDLIYKLVPLNIPGIFLECFNKVTHEIKSGNGSIKNNPDYIFSANSHMANDVFKIYCAENDIKILGMQHGNGYNNMLISPHFDYEKSVCYVLYTWGSGEHYLPHPNLNLKQTRKKYKYKLIIIDNMMPKYTFRFHSYPIGAQQEKIIYSTKLLLNRLSPDFHKKILFRFYRGRSFEQFDIKRYYEEYKDIIVEDREPFIKSINDSEIVFINHHGTTILQALYSNKPIVIFMDPNYNEYSEKIKPIYEKLKSVKILHEDIESAAAHLNEISSDTNEWWFNKDVQERRKEFVYHFARGSETFAKDWTKEFDRITTVH